MNRDSYLGDPHVRAFVDWAAPLVSGERALKHQWESRRWGSWSCETLFDAYRGYDWPFSCRLPGDPPRAVGTRTRTPLRSSTTSDASFGAALRRRMRTASSGLPSRSSNGAGSGEASVASARSAPARWMS